MAEICVLLLLVLLLLLLSSFIYQKEVGHAKKSIFKLFFISKDLSLILQGFPTYGHSINISSMGLN